MEYLKSYNCLQLIFSKEYLIQHNYGQTNHDNLIGIFESIQLNKSSELDENTWNHITNEPQTWSCDKYRKNALDRISPFTYLSTSQKPLTLNREALWTLGYPDHFVRLISVLHIGTKASVSLRGELSELSGWEWGKTGLYSAATLFSIFLSIVLPDAFINFTQGVWIESRPDVSLFNVS